MDDRDEVDETLDELVDTLEELRTRLEPRPPGAQFRPPTPGEVLDFADRIAIPAAVTLLEVQIRALRALQRAIRLARRERQARETATSARGRLDDVQRATLDRLDRALTDVQEGLSGEGLPSDERARELLLEARRLRDELDQRVRDAADRRSREAPHRSGEETEGSTIPIDDPPDESIDDALDRVDVDAELETLKEQYGRNDGPNDDTPADGEERDDGTNGDSGGDGTDDDRDGDEGTSADDNG